MSTRLLSLLRKVLASNVTRVVLSVVACLLVGIALYSISKSLSIQEIAQALRKARLDWLAVAIALSALGHVFRILRSCNVLAWEARPSSGQVSRALLGAQIINWISPIRAGDIWRIWRLGRSGRNSLLWAASGAVLEKGSDSVVLAVFGMVLLLLPLPSGVSIPITRLIISVVIFLMGFSAISALGSHRLRDRLLARLPSLDRWVNERLPDVQVRHTPAHWLALMANSALIWVLGLAVNMALANAFGIQIDLGTHLLLLLTLQTTTVLAPVPGNLGVFPLISMTVLSAVGVDKAVAAAYGTLLYVVAYGVLVLVAATVFVPAIRLPHRNTRPKTTSHTSTDPMFADTHAIHMLDVRIDLLNASQLIDAVVRTARARSRAIVAYVNAHGMNLAFEQPMLRYFFNRQAKWVFCDGFGVRWGARLSGLPMPERFTPPDWIDPLAQACSAEDLSVYLIGDQAHVVEGAVKELQRRHPGLRIVGRHHGFFDKTPGSADNAHVVTCINAAGPDVLLVGFGMPQQEYWLAENWEHLNAKVGITVGALFTYLSGDIPRAPRWMTDHGLEWLGRLLIEPARLWRRYLVGNPMFLSRIIRARIGLVQDAE